MARRLRFEFPDAIYHVLNRGNYRRDLFTTPGEAQAFVVSVEEAVAAFGWRLHAYAVMSNHYHLALQTPQANLVAKPMGSGRFLLGLVPVAGHDRSRSPSWREN
jgi:putative transposase